MTGLAFDGADDHVECGDVSIFDGVGKLTCVTWIKPSALGAQAMLGKNGSGQQAFSWQIEADGEILVGIGTTNTTNLDIGLVADSWQCIAFTYDDDANTVNAYRNGILEDSGANTGGTIPNTSSSFQIGKQEWVGYERPFNGLLDDIHIHNRALTPKEMGTLAEAPYAAYECRKRPTVFVFGATGNRRRRVICGAVA